MLPISDWIFFLFFHTINFFLNSCFMVFIIKHVSFHELIRLDHRHTGTSLITPRMRFNLFRTCTHKETHAARIKSSQPTFNTCLIRPEHKPYQAHTADWCTLFVVHSSLHLDQSIQNKLKCTLWQAAFDRRQYKNC